MHAFDYDKLSGREIIVRSSKKGEEIVTLDHRKLILPENTLVISDSEKAIAIAGVIGGEETGVTEETTSILLESAYFDHNTIRETSKNLGISTESSIRFSRNIGFYTTEIAINMAVSMIQEGEVSSLSDVKSDKLKESVIKTSFSNLADKIGYNIPNNKMKSILKSLEFEVQTKGDEITIKVPPFRTDVSIEEDIVEEIARIFGYDNIPSTIPKIEKNLEIPLNEITIEQKIRNNLISQGFTEVVNFSFISEKDANLFGLDRNTLIEIQNPMIEDDKILRPLLIINILKTIQRNTKKGYKNLSLFEIGRIFNKNGNFHEEKNLCIALHGKKYENWAGNMYFSYYDLKDIIDRIFLSLGIEYDTIPRKHRFLHDYISGEIIIKDEKVGIIGKIHPEITTKLEIDETYICEISLSKIEKHAKKETTFKQFKNLPISSKNISILVPKDYYVNDIVKFIKNYDTGNPNISIKEVRVMDIYEGESIPQGFKSTNILIKLRWIDEVKEETEIKVVFLNIIKDIQEKLGLSVRGM